MVTDIRVAEKLLSLRNNAIKRNIEFNISFKKLKQLLNSKRCFYTGVEFDSEIDDLKLSIDRVDSSLGYIDSNIVACTIKINQIKSNISEEDMVLILSGIQKFKKRKNGK